MKRNVSELIGFELDWVVGVALGKVWIKTKYPFQPSIIWGDGGPIIEQEKIAIRAYETTGMGWFASLGNGFHSAPTPLIAAMRCFVASKLGDEVDIPDRLHHQ